MAKYDKVRPCGVDRALGAEPVDVENHEQTNHFDLICIKNQSCLYLFIHLF